MRKAANVEGKGGTGALYAQYPSRRFIQAEMLKFAGPLPGKGWKILAIDLGLYIAAVVGVLFLAPLWAKFLCSVFAGLKISNLLAVAHDAAHGTLVRNPRLNEIIAIVALTPCLFNYRLWIYDHHVLHHPGVNGKTRDAFTPFSKAEFDALPPYRRLLERVYRAPCGLGFGIYEIIERWLGVKLFPRHFMPARVRREAWPHFIYLLGYLGLFLTGLALAPHYSDTGPATAILLGFVLPFYVWMVLVAFSVFIQHTHPQVPWFDAPVDRVQIAPPEALSTHIEFPPWLKTFTHDVYDHAAHHVQPRIPCYRLAAAQARLNELLGPHSVKTNFSFGWFADTVRRCKLYDYTNRRWLDFAGNPTTDRVQPNPARLGRHSMGADIREQTLRA